MQLVVDFRLVLVDLAVVEAPLALVVAVPLSFYQNSLIDVLLAAMNHVPNGQDVALLEFLTSPDQISAVAVERCVMLEGIFGLVA